MRSDNNYFDFVDKKFQANLGRLTAGVSPAALMTSCYSWLTQLAQSPGRVLELAFYPAVHFRDCANKNCGNCHPVVYC
jgi:polyhydroxyalkanoate synthase